MHEHLSKAVADLILTTISTADEAKIFILSEMPEVVSQLLLWGALQSLLIFCAFLIPLAAVLYVFYRAYKDSTLPNKKMTEGTIVCLIVCALFAIGFSSLALSNLEWLQILVAPKVYLLEYIRESL